MRRKDVIVYRAAAQVLACAAVAQDQLEASLAAVEGFVRCLCIHFGFDVSPWRGAQHFLDPPSRVNPDRALSRKMVAEGTLDAERLSARRDFELRAVRALGIEVERSTRRTSQWPMACDVWKLALARDCGVSSTAVQIVFPSAYPFSPPLLLVPPKAESQHPLISKRGVVNLLGLLNIDAWNPALRVAQFLQALQSALDTRSQQKADETTSAQRLELESLIVELLKASEASRASPCLSA